MTEELRCMHPDRENRTQNRVASMPFVCALALAPPARALGFRLEDAVRLALEKKERPFFPKHGLEAWDGVGDTRPLAFDVAKTFMQALQTEGVSRSAERKLDAAKLNLETSRARARSGLASSADVTRAELQLATSQGQLANARSNVRGAYGALSSLVGQHVEGPLVPCEHTQAARRFEQERERLLSRSMQNDSELKLATLRSARENFTAAAAAAAAARKNGEKTRARYEQGLATSFEASDASDQQFEAEVTCAMAQLQMEQTYLDLRAALGLSPLDRDDPIAPAPTAEPAP